METTLVCPQCNLTLVVQLHSNNPPESASIRYRDLKPGQWFKFCDAVGPCVKAFAGHIEASTWGCGGNNGNAPVQLLDPPTLTWPAPKPSPQLTYGDLKSGEWFRFLPHGRVKFVRLSKGHVDVVGPGNGYYGLSGDQRFVERLPTPTITF